MSEKRNTIYVIWADRGDYSDRTEYALAWTRDKAKAEARVAWLVAESANWRRRCADADDLAGAWERAYVALDDRQWSSCDDTDYRVLELEELP